MLPDGRRVVMNEAGPDNCGRAELVAVLHNDRAGPIAVHDVLVAVRGAEIYDEAYWVPWDAIPPGEERRLAIEPRGVGVVTVTFRIERAGSVEAVEAHATVRRELRTRYE